MATQAPLTGRSTIGDWLDSPEGGSLIRRLLAQGGQDESAIAPVRGFPLDQLVTLSQGALSQDVVDGLVREVNGGEMPDLAEQVEAAMQPAAWTERITPGRFTGKTVIVT